MSLWSRLSSELRTAGRAAQGAIDEGKVRLELFRMGQLSDKAAQALGYAVHRARREGRELEADVMERLDAVVTKHEEEMRKLEAELAAMAAATTAASAASGAPAAGASTSSASGGSAAPGATPPEA
ncbi:MAG: hypothetical protein HYR75_08185 [Gemmatimonadetes bacterium]|nr:hypothetical protein [Gemmatimonadota bacterium]MBI3569020.1 hypothetical protein [Gemmatimonadota bacterium]